MQHYAIKFVSDLRQVSGFLRFPPLIKLTGHDINVILLKVALNTITLTPIAITITGVLQDSYQS